MDLSARKTASLSARTHRDIQKQMDASSGGHRSRRCISKLKLLKMRSFAYNLYRVRLAECNHGRHFAPNNHPSPFHIWLLGPRIAFLVAFQQLDTQVICNSLHLDFAIMYNGKASLKPQANSLTGCLAVQPPQLGKNCYKAMDRS